MSFSDFDFDYQVLEDLKSRRPVADIFPKIEQAVADGYTHQHYFLAAQLTDQIDIWLPRLTLLDKIVQMPSFIYRPGQAANRFLLYLASSSYWLDQDLFDESLFQKNKSGSLNVSQQIHKKLLDIGSTLIDKGFPLSDLKTDILAKTPMTHWIATYIRQCVRWNKRPHQILRHQNHLPSVPDQTPTQTRI